jgi:tripartite ATP-independent transporter DctM subunit
VRWRAGRLGLPRAERATRRIMLQEAWSALLALLAPVIIVGGIRGGIFTPTEAGAIATVYVLLVGVLVYRGLGLREIAQSLVRAAHGTASVLVILGASSIFAWIIADLGISRQLAEFVGGLGAPAWVVLLLLNLILFAVGMVLDPLAALIILVPIFLPLMQALGVNEIQFGMIVVLNLMIGLCTPPVGYLIYLTATIGEVSPLSVVRESLPFIAVLIVVLLFVTFVPAISLFLPTILAGH